MIVAQNNRYGTILPVNGTLMEFATEEEAREYGNDDDEDFQKVLQKEIIKCKLKYRRRNDYSKNL